MFTTIGHQAGKSMQHKHKAFRLIERRAETKLFWCCKVREHRMSTLGVTCLLQIEEKEVQAGRKMCLSRLWCSLYFKRGMKLNPWLGKTFKVWVDGTP